MSQDAWKSQSATAFDTVLQSYYDRQTNCESDDQTIQEFLSGKTLVVYALQTEIKSPNDNDDSGETMSYLAPIVEKQFDLNLAKSVNIEVQEVRLTTIEND